MIQDCTQCGRELFGRVRKELEPYNRNNNIRHQNAEIDNEKRKTTEKQREKENRNKAHQQRTTDRPTDTVNQSRAPPERKNCTVAPRATPCEHVRTSDVSITERTQTYGSTGTHQEQAPGYLYMLPFGHGATITVGVTLLPACLTRSNPRQSFAIRTHAGRDSKISCPGRGRYSGSRGRESPRRGRDISRRSASGVQRHLFTVLFFVSSSLIYGTHFITTTLC